MDILNRDHNNDFILKNTEEDIYDKKGSNSGNYLIKS